jgi:hypothetical protein
MWPTYDLPVRTEAGREWTTRRSALAPRDVRCGVRAWRKRFGLSVTHPLTVKVIEDKICVLFVPAAFVSNILRFSKFLASSARDADRNTRSSSC